MLAIFVIFLFIPSSFSSDHPPLTYACHSEKGPKCKKLPFVPGHTLLGAGFDIATMKKASASVLDLQAYQSKDKTCTVCKNPYQKMALQKLPVAMTDWMPYSSCTRKVTSEVSRSSVSLAEELESSVKNDWEAGLGIEHGPANAKVVLAGSQSAVNKFTEGKTSSDRYSFIKQQLRCIYYSFRVQPKPLLSQHFKEPLKSLPESYSTKTKPEYRQFVQTFGTHYISQADVGGETIEVTAIKTCQTALDGVSVDELKDCLNLESSAAVTGKMEANAKASACKELSEKTTHSKGFHQTFNERVWQVTGGKVTFDLLSTDGKNDNGAATFDAWMESLKTDPDIVTYSLEPLHNLVRFEGPVKENLRKAISEYILENALRKNCSCSGGSQSSVGAKCTCFCPSSNAISANCCPTKKGLAKLVLTVKNAEGLWGDYISRTDAYVKISYDTKQETTQTIWNNDNPRWNMRSDLGIVELNPRNTLKIEVWDEDHKYDDDLLGRCNRPLTSGEKTEVCYLNHGSLTYKVEVRCLPHLAGEDCQAYASAP
ncbi:perforin-1 [Pelobates fuscus]|uniref:perforin-1 n=1 Tax=Pelobates fuscus TaxID=191477 RepID=UPI002FE4A1BF